MIYWLADATPEHKKAARAFDVPPIGMCRVIQRDPSGKGRMALLCGVAA
ncbi:MAG TPA: hypothetical protein VHZ74_00055 [Bryobacteraceae bacterium]|jgi:hypothetical protein|nr:hypothetical protein [Bryobacteraceae bacterium]